MKGHNSVGLMIYSIVVKFVGYLYVFVVNYFSEPVWKLFEPFEAMWLFIKSCLFAYFTMKIIKVGIKKIEFIIVPYSGR